MIAQEYDHRGSAVKIQNAQKPVATIRWRRNVASKTDSTAEQTPDKSWGISFRETMTMTRRRLQYQDRNGEFVARLNNQRPAEFKR
jgi:hypothetical protein